MRKIFYATSALGLIFAAGVARPAVAADKGAEMSQQIQGLQDQLRALQQQLDSLKAAAAVQADALAQETAQREKVEKAARDVNLEAGGHTVFENGVARNVPAANPKVAVSGANKFSLESADGRYSIAITGRLNLDSGGYINFKPDNGVVGTRALASGFNARRARIGVTGKVAGDWGYSFIYDAGNSQDTAARGIQVAQITYNGFKDVIIDLPGYSEPPFTLETATSSNDIIFMERATPSNVAANFTSGDFRANTGVRFIDDRYWIGLYFTGPSYGDIHTNNHERFGAFQRASAQVANGSNYSIHVGGGLNELLQAPNAGPGAPGQITLNDQPELRIDPTSLLSTGALGTAANPVTGGFIYNVEAAAGWENFYVQGEFDHYSVSRDGLAKANFKGMYVMASWVLTDEHRSYNRATGAYGGITPRENFAFGKSPGALELAARVSYTNLTDNYAYGTALALQPDAVNGGIQTNYTIGMNWYVNTYMRMMFNLVHSDLKKINGTAATGAALGAGVGSQLDAVAARLQVAF